jgi:hypothetical protein
MEGVPVASSVNCFGMTISLSGQLGTDDLASLGAETCRDLLLKAEVPLGVVQ